MTLLPVRQLLVNHGDFIIKIFNHCITHRPLLEDYAHPGHQEEIRRLFSVNPKADAIVRK